MSKPLIFLIALLLFQCTTLLCQERKKYTIIRIDGDVKIDGILDESFWNTINTADNFTQTIPSPDKPSLFKTEVKVVYGKNAIFIGAKLYQAKSELSKFVTARDVTNNINADVFAVFFDTYDDHQNGYAFRVTAAGVQQDERLSTGTQNGDRNWDAVWASKVKIFDDHWTVEMEIPFSAIRFTPSDQMQWGVNFFRLQRKKNESSYWNKIDVQQSGFLSQTGLLSGFRKLTPPVRLFLFPYLSAGYSENPYLPNNNKQWLRSGGMDLKYGLSEAFTLDLTLVPDFSQVISDNLVRNLSPFEQQLTENRPFFTEGVDLFAKADLFYSRRIGARPEGFYKIENEYEDTSKFQIEKNPNVSTLYNAVKISGRTRKNTGIGIFNSVVKPMHASIKDKTTNEKFRVNTSDLTNYNILILDKPLRGQSNIHFANTNVIRNGKGREANASALLIDLFDKDENHVLSANAKTSILYDSLLTVGTSFGMSYGKVSGKFKYRISGNYLSPLFDKTDMGLQFDYNLTTQQVTFSYNENKPKSKFLQIYELSTSHQLQWNAKPLIFRFYEGSIRYFLLFKNFWDLSFEFESKPIAPLDFYQLGRFNKKLQLLPYFYSSFNGSSDSRKKLFWNYNAGYGFSNIRNASYTYIVQGLRYQFSKQIELSVSANITRDNSNIGYALYDPVLEAPIVGRRNVREYEGQVSLKINFTPNMNLTARFRHYNSFIHYISFNQVDAFGAWENGNYPYQNGYDENFNLQNIDLFFNWMFKPGSRIVLSYKQWLGDEYILNQKAENHYFDNVYQIIKSPHAFEIAARVIFFIDYSKLQKK